jgi:eukaryotic-like serine/threonine-protein kinase
MIAKGARLKDRYRLERPLGRGGMAAVWLASDEVLDRPVAIKVLSDTIASDPEFLARFRREARVAAGLAHPNLIGVYDYAEGDERPYLVMEYVPGENLGERISGKAEIDCERLARELLGALSHIHAAGIVHRDVKPGNVLVAPDGSAKLIDFGIALPEDATALTRTGHLLGTARYIAPEVMNGQPATAQSDLYSCGLVLRDCLGANPPRKLRALVARMSAADPGARPTTARQALAQLSSSRAPLLDQPTQELRPASGSTAQTAPKTVPVRLEPPARRGLPWGKVAGGVAALAALAIGFSVLGDSSTDAPPQKKRGEQAKADPNRGSEKAESAATPAAEDPQEPQETEAAEADEPGAVATAPEGDDVALGSSLNQEGFELIQAGAYEEAVPVLEEAVRAFPADTEDVDYAYALFNLGNALRLAGRPDEAIPVLEQRLQIPNQTDVVRRELAAAESEAGR